MCRKDWAMWYTYIDDGAIPPVPRGPWKSREDAVKAMCRYTRRHPDIEIKGHVELRSVPGRKNAKAQRWDR